jgi:hypothetical protein
MDTDMGTDTDADISMDMKRIYVDTKHSALQVYICQFLAAELHGHG